MKDTNRKQLICSKLLKHKVLDRFSVVVSADKADSAKLEYERQGYKVIVL